MADITEVVVRGSAEGFVQEISRWPTSLTQQQRSRLLEIAEKCPVHFTLVHCTLVSETDIRCRAL